MEENKNKNNAESYDFIADAKATINGLIDRAKEHGLFEREDDERALFCMAIDFEREEIFSTDYGKPHIIVAGISTKIINCGLAEKVKKVLDMYYSGELGRLVEGKEYENAEEVQDAEPAAEPGGEE